MDKIADWIKVGIMIVGFLATIGIFIFQSFVTRQEMNARFDAIDVRFSGIDKRLDRMENKLEKLNNQFIDHLKNHD